MFSQRSLSGWIRVFGALVSRNRHRGENAANSHGWVTRWRMMQNTENKTAVSTCKLASSPSSRTITKHNNATKMHNRVSAHICGWQWVTSDLYSRVGSYDHGDRPETAPAMRIIIALRYMIQISHLHVRVMNEQELYSSTHNRIYGISSSIMHSNPTSIDQVCIRCRESQSGVLCVRHPVVRGETPLQKGNDALALRRRNSQATNKPKMGGWTPVPNLQVLQ